MIVTALGTNGWFDTENGQTMCTLIRTQNYSIILDAGYGIRRAKALIDFSKPTYLLLSHMHLDHTIGLHTLDYLQFQLPLTIVVPAGQKQAFEELVRKAENLVKGLGFHFRTVKLAAGDCSASMARTYDIEIQIPRRGAPAPRKCSPTGNATGRASCASSRSNTATL